MGGVMNRGQLLLVLGGLALIIGALLPWATLTSFLVGSFSRAGYEGDGIITGGIGILLLFGGLLVKGKPGKLYSLAGSFFALIAGLILVSDFSNVSGIVRDMDAEESMMASIGPGLYLSALGAVLALVGGLQRVPAAPVPALQPTAPAP